MFDLYNKVIDAFKSGDEGYFTAAVRNWIEASNEAPFYNEEDNNLFYDAKRYCNLWRSKAINSRVSKRRMVESVREIMEKDIPNPYKEEPKEEQPKEELKEEPKTLEGDIIYITELMAQAHAENDKITFEQDAIHLFDIKAENPYHNNTPKYNAYQNLMAAKSKKEIFQAAEELCDIINGKKKTILGILPKKKEGK